ncbi:ATP-binding protein [Akkermansiaceae bacterium]|nr:ATP-binding protein [Akkermansiaceae bacterium]
MGTLHVICGAAGVGKSTYGNKLAAELRACFLDSDTVSEPVVQAGMKSAGMDSDDRDSPEYQLAFRDAVYECLYTVAAENLPAISVVMVGPFTREIHQEGWLRSLEERFDVEVVCYFVTCDEETRRERIEKKANPRDAWKLAHWEDYLAKADLSPPVFHYQAVRT